MLLRSVCVCVPALSCSVFDVDVLHTQEFLVHVVCVYYVMLLTFFLQCAVRVRSTKHACSHAQCAWRVRVCSFSCSVVPQKVPSYLVPFLALFFFPAACKTPDLTRNKEKSVALRVRLLICICIGMCVCVYDL